MSVQWSVYSALQQQAQQAASSLIGHTVQIASIETGAAGDFPYFWQDANNNFNYNTYAFINSLVAPAPDGSGAVQLSGPFDAAYQSVISAISYSLSIADQATLNKAVTQASGQATTVVDSYEQAYGPISDAQMQTAGVTTKINYVIGYQVAAVWSCAQAHKTPPLTWQQMQQARSLSDLLPCIDASGAAILPSVSEYLDMLANILPLQDAASNARWVTNTLTTNTQSPTLTNGGMQTMDDNGNTATHVGFQVNNAVPSIQNDLANTTRTISLAMSVNQVNTNTISVTVNASGAGDIPIEDFILLSVSGGADFNLFSFKGTSSSVTVSMAFQGYSLVPFGPPPFAQDTGSGWYDATPIAQAVANGTNDISGYKFDPQPQYNFAAGGNFGLLTSVLIANYPTITLEYAQGNYNDFLESFDQNSKWDVKVFGIKVGSFSQSIYQALVKENDQEGGFTVTLTPSVETLGLSNFDLRAYVLGGLVTYPGAPTA